jgi:hypothetical protein
MCRKEFRHCFINLGLICCGSSASKKMLHPKPNSYEAQPSAFRQALDKLAEDEARDPYKLLFDSS